MNGKNEQLSLKIDPLPEQEIKDPLSYVFDCEIQIAELEERINDLNQRKQEALDYAILHNINEDTRCKLEISSRKTRSLNIGRFKEVFPIEYEMVCDIERNDIKSKLDHIGEKINITLVDKLIKKPMLDAAQGVITTQETKKYAVVRK